jgi:surface polysaccharide O-acyltransferase-like enzyme
MDNNNINEVNQPQPEKDGVLDDHVSGYQQLELEGYNKSIRKARNWLFAMAGIFLVTVLIQVGDNMQYLPTEYKLLIFGFPGLLVLLAALTHLKPVLCLTLALCFFIGFYLIMFFLTEEAGWLYGGIILKAFCVVALIKGLTDAREAEKLKKDYDMRSGGGL